MAAKLLSPVNLLPRLLSFLLLIFFSSMTFTAQSQVVSGVIRSAADNQPMQGVSVQVKGSSNITVSDAKGRFQIKNVSSADSLLFSSVGFKSETVAVNNRGEVNINLQAESSALD